ncbi:MAG: glycosyltransferase [Verrucomicrobiota bacterium]
MKVVHLTAYRQGGAGSAAFRIHRAMRELGVDSHYLALDVSDDSELGYIGIPKRYLRFYERVLMKVNRPVTAQQKHQLFCEQMQANVFYSSLETDHLVEQNESVRKADIVHLHWTSGLINWNRFFPSISKPIVWTLHDMHSFLGGFHYSTDQNRAPQALQSHNETVIKQQASLIGSAQNLSIVCPSQWLSKLAGDSFVHKNHPNLSIANGLDSKTFKPYPQPFARSVFNLPSDRKIIFFVAERLDDPRKGADLLLETLKQLDLPDEWMLVAAGAGKFDSTKLPIEYVGTVADERLMALLYSAADLFVLPTREDNLPNVIAESLCCGTPVVSNAVGGVPEMIQSGVNGMLAEQVDSTSFGSAIKRAIDHSFERKLISQAAHEVYSDIQTARRYLDTYQEALLRKVNS